MSFNKLRNGDADPRPTLDLKCGKVSLLKAKPCLVGLARALPWAHLTLYNYVLAATVYALAVGGYKIYSGNLAAMAEQRTWTPPGDTTAQLTIFSNRSVGLPNGTIHAGNLTLHRAPRSRGLFLRVEDREDWTDCE